VLPVALTLTIPAMWDRLCQRKLYHRSLVSQLGAELKPRGALHLEH
jgi:hypothetical protein